MRVNKIALSMVGRRRHGVAPFLRRKAKRNLTTELSTSEATNADCRIAKWPPAWFGYLCNCRVSNSRSTGESSTASSRSLSSSSGRETQRTLAQRIHKSDTSVALKKKNLF